MAPRSASGATIHSCKQAGAHRRHGPVHHRQQRAGPAAVAQRPRQFQAAARHLVEEEKAVADPRPQFA